MEERTTDLLSRILVLDLAHEFADSCAEFADSCDEPAGLCAERTGFCAKLLADLGAEVITIARPGLDRSSGTDSFSHAYHNRNKQVLLLDLDSRDDRRVFRRLAGRADVLIETCRRRYLSDRHLSFGYLSGINRRLIHLSVSGFGRTGREPDRPWNDTLISASSGQMYVSGLPEGPPLKLPGNQSRYATALFGAVAILLAIRRRRQTGVGRFIDLSARESLISTLDHVMVDYFHEGTVSRRQGNVYGDMGFAILPCKDGYIQIAVEQNWETIVELMASEDMAGDLDQPKWREKTYRRKNLDHILDAVGRWTRVHGKDELFEMGQAMRFPWAPVCSPEETLKSPQMQARAFFSRPTGKKTDDRTFPSAPYLFDGVRPVPGTARGRVTVSVIGDVASLSFDAQGKGSASDNPGVTATSARSPGSKGVLEGIRVLDFTRMLAGPFATRVLADAGAEVIKVQSAKAAKGGEDNASGYFATWNRNKRSVALDLEYPEARQLTLALAARSDIVMESFSPRVMAGWGLTYGRFREAKPDIIMASISAMGQTGPWKDYVGFGPTFHALSGLTHAMSRHLQKPVCLGHAYGDTIIGLYAALAVLAALHHRDATGIGRYIDISGYEAVCSVLGPVFTNAATNKGFTGDAGLFEGTFRCCGEDRWCVVTVADEGEWHRLCGVIGARELYSPRFSTPRKRLANRATLEGIIGRWTGSRTAEDAARSFQRAGVSARVVLDARDLAGDSELAARGNFVTLQHPLLGATVSDRTPLFFGLPEPDGWRAGPLLGADNGYVLGEILGMSNAEIKDYIKKGVIG